MSSIFLSPNTLRSGLWSVATMRSLQPRTKCLALSSAQATAKASPSPRPLCVYIGCWRLSVSSRFGNTTVHRKDRSSVSVRGRNRCRACTRQLRGMFLVSGQSSLPPPSDSLDDLALGVCKCGIHCVVPVEISRR